MLIKPIKLIVKGFHNEKAAYLQRQAAFYFLKNI
jgi:hypothetical protein